MLLRILEKFMFSLKLVKFSIIEYKFCIETDYYSGMLHIFNYTLIVGSIRILQKLESLNLYQPLFSKYLTNASKSFLQNEAKKKIDELFGREIC